MIEVVVSMTMMTILGFSLWGAFSVAMSTSGRIPDVTEVGVKLISMDSTIRNLLNRVKIPYYLPLLEDIEESDEELKLPYLDGVKDKYLNFYFDEGMLEITTILPEETEDFSIDTSLPDIESETTINPDEQSSEQGPLSDTDKDKDKDEKKEKEQKPEEPILISFGPFKDFDIELEEENSDQPLAVKFTAEPEYENYGEIYIYARLGSQPLWVE